MKSVTPIGYVILTGLFVSLLAVSIPWVYEQMQISLDKSEIVTIKNEFMKCSEKILETIRTGSSNRCVFSVSRGDLYVKEDGIYYKLASKGRICDEHEFALIDFSSKVWQKCKKSNGLWVYELKWFYPKNDTVIVDGTVVVELPSGAKSFELVNKGAVNVGFESSKGIKGKTIELTRKVVEEDRAILRVKIY